MENIFEFETVYDGFFRKRGLSRNMDKYGEYIYTLYEENNGKWVKSHDFTKYNTSFFKTIDRAMLWLNGYEAALALGASFDADVYKGLVKSEVMGNLFRAGETASEYHLSLTGEAFIQYAKKYVKYI